MTDDNLEQLDGVITVHRMAWNELQQERERLAADLRYEKQARQAETNRCDEVSGKLASLDAVLTARLKRCVQVEQALLDAASAGVPADAASLRAWAAQLGVPDEFRASLKGGGS